MVAAYLRQLGYERVTARRIAAAIALETGTDPAAALARAMTLSAPGEDWRNLPDTTEAPLVFPRQDITPPSLHRILRRLRATAATLANDG